MPVIDVPQDLIQHRLASGRGAHRLREALLSGSALVLPGAKGAARCR